MPDDFAAAFAAVHADAAETPVQYARQTPLYSAASLHPELRFTRLGAVLRQLASSDPDPTSAELDPAIAISRTVLAADHAQPLDLLPLHALRDYMLENPEHDLAKRFNWERLPEKLALDQTTRDAPLVHGLGWNYLLGHMTVEPGSPTESRLAVANRAIRKEHPWASEDDIRQSLWRVRDQHHFLRSHRSAHDQWHDAAANDPEEKNDPAYEHYYYAADAEPLRYAKAKPPRVHPLLRGTRLALVLRELTRDPIESVRGLAKHSLYSDPTATLILADALEENGHPLYGHYNWRAVPEKLHHDAAVLKAVKARARHERGVNRAMGLTDNRSLLDAVNGTLGSILGGYAFADADRDAIAAAVRREFPHASDAHVDASLRRVYNRVLHAAVRRISDDPRYHVEARRQQALRTPDEAQAHIDAAHAPNPEYADIVGFADADRGRHARAKAEEAALRYERRVGGVANALRLLRSANQGQTRSVAAEVLERLKLSPSKVRDGVTLSGAPVASIVAAVYHGGDEAKADAAAAYFGHLTQLPSVTAFHAAADGPDSLYRLRLPLDPVAASRHLHSHGVVRAVLLPTRSGTDVLVHDPGRRQASRVAAAAGDTEVQETVGRSVRFGGSAGHRADADTRRSYRDAIAAYEGTANARD